MENIFIEFLTQNYYFNTISNLKWDLYNYLFEILNNENNNTLKLDLNPILTTNTNGEYI
jgi:hypothetical protein